MRPIATALVLAALPPSALAGQDLWTDYPPAPGGGLDGRRIVLVSGDEEYRSEEALPQLGKILAQRHGARARVLFAVDPETGTIDPDVQTNVPGLEALDDADFVVLFLRFRELPDEQMRHIVGYVESGRPLLAIRTSTHAFFYRRNPDSPYADWSFQHDSGGFGRRILGETWVSHHGVHGEQSTRGVLASDRSSHPILRGVSDLWGPTDVYTVRDLPEDAEVLVRGQVLDGMTPDAPPSTDGRNEPMLPVVWTRQRPVGERTQRIVVSTLGAATDLESAHLRRLFVNAVYWGLSLEPRIPDFTDARTVGDYRPTPFGFDNAVKGRRPSAHALADR